MAESAGRVQVGLFQKLSVSTVVRLRPSAICGSNGVLTSKLNVQMRWLPISAPLVAVLCSDYGGRGQRSAQYKGS